MIAVDCDDTLSRTNETICRWHNETYGTSLTIDDFHHFQYWRVKGWGDRAEAQKKVKEFNHSGAWDKIPVIQEAVASTKKLKEMGHTLVIITARMASEAIRTRDWIEATFPDTFSELYFTSAFESRAASDPTGPDVAAANVGPESDTDRDRLPYKSIPKPKSDICQLVGAKLLVDDSIENAYNVYENTDIPVALYGDWQWNKKTLDKAAAASPKSYAQRLADGEEERTDDAELPERIYRTMQWSDVVELVEKKL